VTVPSLQIDEIDPHDETAFRPWYGVHSAAVTAGRVAPLIESAAAMAASMREARVARSYQSLVSLALAPTGTPAGYTLIYLDRTSTEHALQDDTFVGRTHRGHNLGARLKIANLAQLAEHRGDRRWLHTWTAQSNAAMQAVNARFGFRVVEQLHELERAG
jgi:GNAT superfamily N-acetyltransferase